MATIPESGLQQLPATIPEDIVFIRVQISVSQYMSIKVCKYISILLCQVQHFVALPYLEWKS